MTKTERRLELVAEYRRLSNKHLAEIEAVINGTTKFTVFDEKTYIKQSLVELRQDLAWLDLDLDLCERDSEYTGEPWYWPEPTEEELNSTTNGSN